MKLLTYPEKEYIGRILGVSKFVISLKQAKMLA
jgi:hypothetical protein